jgi:hypothetical protein
MPRPGMLIPCHDAIGITGTTFKVRTKTRPMNRSIQGLNLGSGGYCLLPMVWLSPHLLCPTIVERGNIRHSGGKARCESWQIETGDDRNAGGIAAAGSCSISAMECCKSVVRAIPTVSILILAPQSRAFKVAIREEQRKCICRHRKRITPQFVIAQIHERAG